jgi:hypothetical protein
MARLFRDGWLWRAQPKWFKRLRLFLGIVWRMHEGGRMTVECSWAVAMAMYPRARARAHM